MVGKVNKSGEKSPIEHQMTVFGQYLEELRRDKRWSLGELSDELRKHGAPNHGTSRQHLGALERGEVLNPSPKLLEDLAKALNAMSAEYWIMAGHIPPGGEESKEAYTLLLQEAHRKGFKRMLKDEGLSEAAIREVVSKVSDETIDRVVRREEPLLIDRGSLDSNEVAEHHAAGYEEHVVASLSMEEDRAQVGETPGEYLDQVKDNFGVKGRPSKRAQRRKEQEQERERQRERERYETTIDIGSMARIQVRGNLSTKEREALNAVAHVIHALLRY